MPRAHTKILKTTFNFKTSSTSTRSTTAPPAEIPKVPCVEVKMTSQIVTTLKNLREFSPLLQPQASLRRVMTYQTLKNLRYLRRLAE